MTTEHQTPSTSARFLSPGNTSFSYLESPDSLTSQGLTWNPFLPSRPDKLLTILQNPWGHHLSCKSFPAFSALGHCIYSPLYPHIISGILLILYCQMSSALIYFSLSFWRAYKESEGKAYRLFIFIKQSALFSLFCSSKVLGWLGHCLFCVCLLKVCGQ